MTHTTMAKLQLGAALAALTLLLWPATPAGAEVDSDGDGVADVDDAFPDDPTRAVVCDLGSFGAFECAPASPGTFVDVPGALAPTPCPLGTFQPASGASSCLLAPPGTFVDVPGAATATPCAIGTFQAASGASSCTLAPLGSYVDTLGATSASPCPSGTTTLALGASSSADCVPIAASPTSKQACQTGGWRALTDAAGRPFRNQGDCVSFVATGGRHPGRG